jgi:RimJ/RimL family protein N-acetyltransferase
MPSPRLNQFGQPIGDPVPNWQPPSRPVRTPLEGPYARLEPLDIARHTAELFAASALDRDGRNWTYLFSDPPQTLEAYEAWARGVASGDDPFFYAIRHRATARLVGVASYLRIDPKAGSIEVGHINFSPLAQRTRVSTDAMHLMMANVFQLGYRRYEWKCDALNAPSRTAAARLGFIFEGVFRQALVYKGRNRDTAWFSITDAEFPALDRAFGTWLAASNFDAEGRQRVRLADLIERERPA